jgi:hypothetical protein
LDFYDYYSTSFPKFLYISQKNIYQFSNDYSHRKVTALPNFSDTSAIIRATLKYVTYKTCTLHGEAGMIALSAKPALWMLAFWLGIHAGRGSL